MDFIRNHKIELIVFFLITAFFFLSRLYQLTALPIFTDEAIYIRWSQIAKQDANWRFISLTDGKQPSFVWIAMIIMKLVDDPLLAGRLVSVLAGFVSLIGMFFLGREIFKNKWAGIVSSFLYLIFPMSLVYDRMALYDSLVSAFSVWSLYLTILLVRRLRLDAAILLGMTAGAGVLTKTSGFFIIYLLPFSLLLLDWGKNGRHQKLLKFTALALVTVILTYGYYSILRLSPFFNIITEKNAIFVFPFSEWITHPFRFFIGNWKAFWDWLTIYTTVPILLLIFFSFFIKRSFFREKLFLLIWFIVPVIALALFGRVLYPRFIFFMILPLLPLAAFSLINLYKTIGNKIFFGILCLFVFSLALRSDYLILNDFKNAPIPFSDLGQYNHDWPSGWGIKEAVSFLDEEAKTKKIFVATEGTFGLMPYALEIYLINNKNIEIKGFWPVDEMPAEVLEKSKKMPTYFVFYQPCQHCQYAGLAPSGWPLEVVYQYEKYHVQRYFTLYKVKP